MRMFAIVHSRYFSSFCHLVAEFVNSLFFTFLKWCFTFGYASRSRLRCPIRSFVLPVCHCNSLMQIITWFILSLNCSSFYVWNSVRINSYLQTHFPFVLSSLHFFCTASSRRWSWARWYQYFLIHCFTSLSVRPLQCLLLKTRAILWLAHLWMDIAKIKLSQPLMRLILFSRWSSSSSRSSDARKSD